MMADLDKVICIVANACGCEDLLNREGYRMLRLQCGERNVVADGSPVPVHDPPSYRERKFLLIRHSDLVQIAPRRHINGRHAHNAISMR